MGVTADLVVALAFLAGLAVGAVAIHARRTGEVVRLSAELDHARQAGRGERELLERGTTSLRESFQAMSAEALRRNNEEFLTLAEERLRQASAEASGELTRREQAIQGLVNPMRESLAKFEAQVRDVERERTSSYADLRRQVAQASDVSEQLRTETASLVNALRAPAVRGRWGEMQLRRVVESAGMVEHCDFDEQVTVSADDGALRPDLVVRLSGGKQVVVDAKVPFAGYLEAMEARDEAGRAERRKAHARHVREHIDKLAAKEYWRALEATPEFVVMFVPADAFLNAALEEDPSLQELAFERRVVVATPSTLIAMLRTISYAWRQEALAANAADVLRLGRELHGRLATMGGHVAKLGNQLGSAVKTYNDTVGSLEGRVLVTARKFADLKVTGDALDAPDQVEVATRAVAAPELIASAEEALVEIGHRSRAGEEGVDPTDRAAAREAPG
jgi:DNA recombination protein RmuC